MQLISGFIGLIVGAFIGIVLIALLPPLDGWETIIGFMLGGFGWCGGQWVALEIRQANR